MARRHFCAVIVTLLGVGACCGDALAKDGVGYGLEVDSDTPSFSFNTLAPRLAGDLESAVTPMSARGNANVRVRYRGASRELTVRVELGSERILERTVTATGDDNDVLSEAALLASNLVRDEARELLDIWRPAPSTPRPVVAPLERRRPTPTSPVTFALAYPLATNLGRPEIRTHFDLSLVLGRVGQVEGAQIGLVGVYASRGLEGVQIATVASVVRGELRGAQVSVVASVVPGTIVGTQVAGVANVAGSVEGVQIGVVNVARNVHGVQLGVIDIADEVEGQQLGIVSISRRSVHPIAWSSNLAYTNAGFKFVGRYVSTTAAMTVGTNETAFDELGFTGALGTRLVISPISRRLVAEADLALTYIDLAGGAQGNLWLSPRLQVGWSLFEHLRIFGGLGSRFALVVGDGRKVVRPEVLGGVEF